MREEIYTDHIERKREGRMSRRNYRTGKYALDKNEYLNAVYYARRYRKWLDEYHALADSGKGIRYDLDKVQTSGDYDPVEAAGIRRAELSKKIKQIEQTAIETDPDLAQWILQSVTDEFATFSYLSRVKGLPCSRNTLSRRRSKYYFLLAQKI